MTTPIELAIVRIYSNRNEVKGAGFLVSPTHILTCAHVIAFALSIRADSPEIPTAEVELDFPRVAPGRKLRARVVFWLPVDPNAAEEDIAALEFLDPLPNDALPVRLVTSEDLWGHQFRVLGFPEGKANGVWASGVLRGRIANGWVQLEDVKAQGYRLEEGFSGAPVWDDELQNVAGMAVAAEKERQETKAAFIIPTNVLVSAWSELQERTIASCPYRGLFAFREEDTRFFFGREVFVEKLVAAVRRQSLVAVIGPSGSGKSSVVFAGLIPQLREQQGWLIEVFRPESKPFYNLAERLIPLLETQMSETAQLEMFSILAKKLKNGDLVVGNIVRRILQKQPAQRFLLIVDQFEELYTSWRDESDCQVFLDQLLSALQQIPNLTLVMTLRADFLSYALSYRPLADALQDADVKIAPMNRQELREAIEKPAQLLGVKIEAGLTERILDIVEGKPGNLPLLEFALEKLWSKQQKGQLTHQSYEGIGGVEMALTNYADKVYEELKEAEYQQQAQQIFVQLVYPGEGTEDTRRLATRIEVGDENWKVVTKFADRRLVVTGNRKIESDLLHTSQLFNSTYKDDEKVEETVEIVHEALIQKWERLREWIKHDRKFRIWQEELRADLRRWRNSQQDRGALLRGLPLNQARDWLQKRRTYLTPDEREYIELSWDLYRQEEAERQEKEYNFRIMSEANQTLENANQQAKRRIKIGSTFLGMSLLVAVIASLFATQAIQGFQEASEGTKLEQAGVSALRQFRSGEIEALLSAMQSGQRLNFLIQDGRPPKNYPAASPILALQKILGSIREQNRFNSDQEEIKSASFSPDGQLIATAGKDGLVKLWTLSGKVKLKLEGHEGGVLGGVNSISFSPNGQRIATAGEDKTVRLWDLAGKQLAQMDGHQSEVNSVSFSPDGQEIVSAGTDGTVRLWDLSGTEKKRIEAHKGEINSVVFSPDGEKIATAGEDGIARIWEKSGQKLLEIKHGQQVFSASFSPNGQSLATAADDNIARLWSLSGDPKGIFKGHQGWVTRVNFSPSGQRLATAADDGTVRLWDISGEEIAQLQGHRGVVWSATFSPDGRYLVTSGRDGTVRLWNLSPREGVHFSGFKKDVNTIAFSPDGKHILGAGDEGIARIWTVAGEEVVQWQASSRGPIWAVAFSPDGESVATAGWGSIVRIWDKSGKLQTSLKGHKSWVNSLDFSPNGKWLATSGADRTARLWSISGELLATLDGHEAVVGAVGIGTDGQKIVTGDWNGEIRLWNQSGKLLRKWQGHDGQVRDLSFSSDGKQLVTVATRNQNRLDPQSSNF